MSDLGRVRLARTRLLAPALAALSQGLGLLQLVLLFRNFPAGAASDAYFYLYNWSLLPIQIVLLGVVYPLWLRSVPLGPGRVAGTAVGVAASSVVACFGGTVILTVLGKGYPSIWLHCELLGAAGVASALGWAGALHSAARGRPGWLSSVTLFNSLGGCVAMAFPATSLDERVTQMCVGMLVGSCLFAVLVLSLGIRVPGESLGAAETGSDGSRWYFAKSVVGYGAGISLQSMTASLGASSLSSLNIVIKIVSGFSTVVTNTIMPRLVHSRTTSSTDAFTYGWQVLFLSTGVAAVSGGVELAHPGRYPALGLVIAAWILASSLSASMQRVALRFFPPRYALPSLVLSVAVPALVLLARLGGRLDLAAVLVAYVVLDLLIGVVLAAIMGGRRLATASCVSALLMVGFGVAALHGGA